jgi:hypothetical protein
MLPVDEIDAITHDKLVSSNAKPSPLLWQIPRSTKKENYVTSNVDLRSASLIRHSANIHNNRHPRLHPAARKGPNRHLIPQNMLGRNRIHGNPTLFSLL